MGRICDGKKKFVTETEAIRAALNYSRRMGSGIRTYRCPICKGWHLTTHTEDGESMKNEFAKTMEGSV